MAAMLVHRTKEKEFVWELDSIIMQTMSHHFKLNLNINRDSEMGKEGWWACKQKNNLLAAILE